MGFFKKAWDFYLKTSWEADFVPATISRPVTFKEVTFDSREYQPKIDSQSMVIQAETGGQWMTVGLVRKLTATTIHFSVHRKNGSIPDSVVISRDHKNTLIAVAKYKAPMYVKHL